MKSCSCGQSCPHILMTSRQSRWRHDNRQVRVNIDATLVAIFRIVGYFKLWRHILRHLRHLLALCWKSHKPPFRLAQLICRINHKETSMTLSAKSRISRETSRALYLPRMTSPEVAIAFYYIVCVFLQRPLAEHCHVTRNCQTIFTGNERFQ